MLAAAYSGSFECHIELTKVMPDITKNNWKEDWQLYSLMCLDFSCNLKVNLHLKMTNFQWMLRLVKKLMILQASKLVETGISNS